MSHDESFGRFVRDRRRALDLTQEELARRVGCAAITIRKIEADELRPSVQIAERLAMALAIPLDDRAEFVRRARAARPEPAEMPTPAPALEEIGREDLTGRAIRGYALADRIGAGGMGAVYRAIQPNVEREVAIKIILPAYANHPDFIRRFEAEAQLVARLEHPHIVPLYDYWREPGVAYLVMRLLRGGSVQALIQNGPLPLETAYHLLEQMCSALNAAHRIGVIHRDLKPANVLLDEDSNAYLADFGIAKNLGNPNLEAHTQMDVVMGSPQYMSPEQIRSLSVKPQTDIYCLGVMLYEMLTGSLPFTGPTPFDLIQQHINAPMPPLSARRAGLPAALDEVIGRATAKDPQGRYHDVSSLLDDFRRALEGSLTARPVFMPSPDEEAETEPVNPYKGLRAFNEADAEDFFGRESLIQQLLARLGEGGDLSRFLAVVGPSGNGKSSVVGAGLVPAIRQGGLPGSENWFIVDLTPGPHPFEELEAALLRVAVNPPESLLAQLKDGERGLLRAVRRILPADESVELVLVIDQFEEVFTLMADEEERALLLSSLVAAVLDERSRVRLVITLRADFTDRPLRYVDFGELVQRRSEFVLPLTPDELERAILGPAKRAGLRLEAGLTSAMIREIGDQPGALPLLQYALTELFEKREGRTLTKEAYADIGGVLGALGRRAEEIYASLKDDEQALARQLFLRLVTLGEGVEDTRRRVSRAELTALQTFGVSETPKVLDGVMEAFGKSRLLSFDRDPITRGPTVEVAHEALLREWARLREWLNESRADVRLQRQLAQAAAEWQNAKQESSYLLTGAKLEQFEGWRANTSVALTGDERAYLDASIAERDRSEAEERERQRRELEAARKLAETERARAEEQVQYVARVRTRNRVIAAAGVIALILAALAGLFGLQSNQNAMRAQQNLGAAQVANTQSAANAATAQAASLLAEQQRNAALSAQATTQAESVVRATAEADAEQNALVASSRELAAAALSNLTIDPERSALLSLQAISKTYSINNSALSEAEESLRRSLHAMRLQLSIPVPVYPAADQLIFVGLPGTHQTELGCSSDWTPDCPITALTYDEEDGIWERTFLIQPKNDEDKKGPRYKVALEKSWALNYGLNAQRYGADIPLVVDRPTQVKFYFDNVTHWVTDNHNNTIAVLIGDFQQVLGCKQNDDPGCLRSWLEDPEGDGSYTFSTTRLQAGQYQVRVAVNESLDEVYGQDGTRDGAPIIFTVLRTGQDVSFSYDAKSHKLSVSLADAEAPHLTQVGAVAFSPDGTRIAVGNSDHTTRLYDAGTGKELLVLRGHSDRVTSVAFSPDGNRLATASEVGAAKIWDVATGKALFSLINHKSVNSITYSPDGKRIATASDDRTAKVWDAETGEELLTLIGHTGTVTAVIFNPEGTRIATAGYDDTARVWDATTGKELLTLKHDSWLDSITFSPDGQRLATANQDRVARIWDAKSGKQLLSFYGHKDIITSIAFSRDGTRLATCGGDALAKIWNAANGQELLSLSGHTSICNALAFSPDGSHLATVSDDGTVKIWNVSPEGSREWLTLAGYFDTTRTVSVYSPDGKYIATGSWDGTAKLWDASSGRELLNINHPPRIRSIAFSPDGTHFATTSDDGVARIWDVSSGNNTLTLRGHHTTVITSVQFSPDGKRIVTGSWDNTAKVWSAITGQELFTLSGHTHWVRRVAYSPDGKFIATTSDDSTARLWDANTGKALHTFSGFQEGLSDIAFSPDGTRIAIASYDGTVKIWNVSNYTLILVLSGHVGGAMDVAFSPDGKLLAVGTTADVHIWDTTTGDLILTIPGYGGMILSVAFSPDQTRMLTGNMDGTASVYALKLEDLIALAKSRLTRSLTTEECQKYLHVEKCP